jgi:hypothetical protein
VLHAVNHHRRRYSPHLQGEIFTFADHRLIASERAIRRRKSTAA